MFFLLLLGKVKPTPSSTGTELQIGTELGNTAHKYVCPPPHFYRAMVTKTIWKTKKEGALISKGAWQKKLFVGKLAICGVGLIRQLSAIKEIIN